MLVEGFGRNAALTARAANELPPEVTFGFSSYGDDLDQQVRAVRAAGHEVMLQLSSDGTGAPAPGAKAHVLTTGLDSKDMLERLHWQMSRFTGYVGVAGRFDGSFAGDRQSVQPVLQDVASRGLFFIDDGKATPSVASQVPADANRPPKRGEPIFTGTDDGRALDRLVQRAGTDRCAIGIAGAAPETVAQVVAFAHSLEARGITLVPVSTCAASPRNATAQVQP